MDNRPIGVFDSGIGGLSGVRELKRELNNESIVYFGDTARTPYGDKSPETIRQYTCQITDFLASKGVKMLVIACNTITALCLDVLRERYPDIPVVGIIAPTAKYMAQRENKHNIGVIATKATINSGLYTKLLIESGVKTEVFAKATPLLVPIIEGGFAEGVVAETITKHYLDEMVNKNKIGSLILGCTHYPFVEQAIRTNYPELEIINPATVLSKEVKKLLIENDMAAEDTNTPEYLFCASDLSPTFKDIVSRINPDGRYTLECQSVENY
ncbi:MAG: glutamate racemase [Clostridia bacterium]|nr:glutamate racemase [Clostridia bacterium]